MINDNTKNDLNLGIQILRSLLCFWIVLNHCLNRSNKKSNRILFKYTLHVPCFIIISFFFSFKTIYNKNIIKIKKRFQRLLIPYLVFPIIILILNNLLYTFTSFSIYKRILNFNDLFYQYIFGRKFIPVFWFQFYLIWSTLLFIIISLLFREQFFIIIIHILIISYCLQYSSFNCHFFSYFEGIVKHSLGIFVEMLPISVSGCLISSFNLLKLIKKKIMTVYLSIIFLFFFLFYDVFRTICSNSYSGIALNIGSIFLFIIFYFFPINYINCNNLKRYILIITKYTQGIYCFHMLIKYLLDEKLEIIKDGSYIGCFFIYILCYFISFLGYKLINFVHS